MTDWLRTDVPWFGVDIFPGDPDEIESTEPAHGAPPADTDDVDSAVGPTVS
ncbi:MAG: hypothetical protein AAGN46_13640 [Acidobacteriota bacterium]